MSDWRTIPLVRDPSDVPLLKNGDTLSVEITVAETGMDLAEVAWEVAGRLLLVLHLEDVRLDCLSRSSRYADHERLEGYGYDMSGCSCIESKPLVLSPTFW